MHIFHLIPEAAFQQARQRGAIEPARGEAFVHCATREQIVPVANALLRGQEDLLLLRIDPERLEAEVAWEAPDPSLPSVPGLGADPRLPHVYGDIPLTAVTEVFPFPPQADGSFVLPDGVAAPR